MLTHVYLYFSLPDYQQHVVNAHFLKTGGARLI